MVNNLDQVTKTLNAYLAGDSLPHAYLFIGGSGAKQVGLDFAGKILGFVFPNVDAVQFDANGENSTVEGIREVLQVASLLPVQSPYKVVVMENMEQASTQMMNALLKTLEEPPKHAIFILFSTRALLPTVMSRCQVFSLSGTASEVELSEEVAEGLSLLKQHVNSGTAERMALVGELADLEDVILQQVIEQWLQSQRSELSKTPEKFSAVRSTMATLQALEGNFNKKIVLQDFVISALV